jgi:hypothetical protein
MWSKFLLSGIKSPLVLWVEKLKSILNVVRCQLFFLFSAGAELFFQVCLLFSEAGQPGQSFSIPKIGPKMRHNMGLVRVTELGAPKEYKNLGTAD